MPTVLKSAIVPLPCESMFALVDDVESYPLFLPWCRSAQVFERSEHLTRARLDVAYRGLVTHVSTRNAKRAPHEMHLELVDGPFERFEGTWRFAPLGDEGCRVELSLDYVFSSAALQTLMGPVFGHIATTMVQSFVERAEALG
jgi:ribosome-associated toxin RatA of RatAB toxin-antitoxin module